VTRTYSLLIEGDESGYSAHVPELPTILVTGQSIDELEDPRGGGTTWFRPLLPQSCGTEIEVDLPLV
jgi:hypothetical protein